MRVSVVFAFRNREALVRRALTSLKHLSDVETQLVAVDGHSTDGAGQIVREFSPDVLIQRSPAGVYDAWNYALDHCTSDWVLFLNSDDEFSPGMREVLRATLHTEAAVLYGDAVLEHSHVGVELREDRVSWPRQFGILRAIRAPLPFNSAVYSRHALDEIGRFEGGMRFLGDRHLIYRLAISGHVFEKVTGSVTYRYHSVADSLTMSGKLVPVGADLRLWAMQETGTVRTALGLLSAHSEFRLIVAAQSSTASQDDPQSRRGKSTKWGNCGRDKTNSRDL